MTHFKTYLKMFMTVIILTGSHKTIHAQNSEETKIHQFSVKIYDGLHLPAQVLSSSPESNKLLLLINGSTPYDEKGYLGAFWNDKGKIITEKHEFYNKALIFYPGFPVQHDHIHLMITKEWLNQRLKEPFKVSR